MAGGMHGRRGACMVGDMRGRGRAWWACVAWGWVHVWQARTPPGRYYEIRSMRGGTHPTRMHSC